MKLILFTFLAGLWLLPLSALAQPVQNGKSTIGGTTFITKQDKNGKTTNYVLIGGKEKATVLTPAEIKAFMKSGKAKELGTVKRTQVQNAHDRYANQEIAYIQKGNKNLYLKKNGDELTIIQTDIPSKDNLAKDNNISTPLGDKCRDKCYDILISCLVQTTSNTCEEEYNTCTQPCIFEDRVRTGKPEVLIMVIKGMSAAILY